MRLVPVFLVVSGIIVRLAVAQGNLPEGADTTVFFYECSGGITVVAEVTEDSAWLFLPGNTLQLARIPSASGQNYSDGSITYRSEGQEARVDAPGTAYRDCVNNRARAVWEHSKLSGNDFRAVGNEPGWFLEVAASDTGPGKKMLFVGDYGGRRIEFPDSTVTTDAGARKTIFSATTGTEDIVVVLEGKQCSDTMTGELFETTVTIELVEQQYLGCGRALH